jgi:hypothetical protein
LKLANAPLETKCRAVVEIALPEVSKYLKFEPSSTHVELAQTTHYHRYINNYHLPDMLNRQRPPIITALTITKLVPKAEWKKKRNSGLDQLCRLVLPWISGRRY